jgi:hypothetical protein
MPPLRGWVWGAFRRSVFLELSSHAHSTAPIFNWRFAGAAEAAPLKTSAPRVLTVVVKIELLLHGGSDVASNASTGHLEGKSDFAAGFGRRAVLRPR